MPPEPHAKSGSVSSDGSTTKLLSDRYSFSSLPAETYVRNQLNTSVSSRMLFGDGVEERSAPNYVVENEHECLVHFSKHHINQDVLNLRHMVRADHVISTSTGASDYYQLNTSVTSRMLFGDGVGDSVEELYVRNNVDNEPEYDIIQYDHCNAVESERECTVYSSEHHIDQEVLNLGPLVRADHVISTSAGSSDYSSVRELTYDRLYRSFLQKSKQISILLCLSINVGLIAFSLVAIFTAQYIKSIKNVYRYENCALCADLTEDDKISITYLRRLGELKYCCFESSRDPVSRLNKAVMKTFAPTIIEKQLHRNNSIETNGTDAAMELTLEIGEVSKHFISDGRNLPMRKLKPLSGDIKVEQDRLVIQKPGRYFVRSQFDHNMKFVKEELKKLENVVGHDIHRANPKLPNDGKDQLMVSFYTAREYFPKTDYHVSHMAGIFQLKENDKIYVGVTENSKAHFDTSRNRLSLIFLGD